MEIAIWVFLFLAFHLLKEKDSLSYINSVYNIFIKKWKFDCLDDKSAKKEESDSKAEQDPYFKEDPQANEHERFREAEERLEKRHRKKVTKIITEWSELFTRYNKMKEKDPAGAEQYKRNMWENLQAFLKI